jgi:hypothetical protein
VPLPQHVLARREQVEFIPNLIRKSVAVGHIKEIAAHLAQRRPNAAAPIAFLDNERNPVAGGFSLVWAFSAKNEVPRAPSTTEPASRDRSAMHFPKRSLSRSKCKDLGFAGGAPQWHRDHQRGDSGVTLSCPLGANYITWSLSLGARLEPARATRPW